MDAQRRNTPVSRVAWRRIAVAAAAVACLSRSYRSVSASSDVTSVARHVASPSFRPAGCFHANTDYVGHDIAKVEDGTITSPSSCQTACQQTAGCQYWTFVGQTSSCYLKDHQALLGHKHSSDTVGMTSGPRDCLPQASAWCFEGNVDYAGYDVEKVESGQVTSATACQQLCMTLPQCYYFTWVSSENNCYLKGSGAIQGRRSNYATVGMVSGPKVCHSNPPGACYELNVDYYGHDVQKIETGQVTTATMCHELCRGKEGCFHWTWVKQTQSCYLKGPYALQGRVHDSTKIGMVSGPKTCINPPVPCYEMDVDYRGGLVSETGPGSAASTSMCQSLCQASRVCYFWTWDRTTRNCYLKDSTASSFRVSDASTIGFVSGPKDCDPLPPACMELDVDYFGHDIKKIEDEQVDSAASCQSRCQATSGCIYWTWVSQTMKCYLKDMHALIGRVQSPQTVGMVSGPKYCTPTPPGCHEWDVDYQGFDIKKLEGQCSSAKMCQSMCQGTTGCSFWSYVSSTNSCYLKSHLALNGHQSNESTLGIVSGPAFCPIQPICREENVDYAGYDVQKIESGDVASATQCQALCEQLPECSFWTWVSYTRHCYLKNHYALIGRDAGPAAAGMTSGPKRCTAVPQACHEYNVDYRGHDVKKLESGKVLSADTCRALCQVDHSCHYWTWVRATNNCYLKDQYAPLGRIQDGSTAGMVSGSRRCGEQFAGSCYESGVDYYGYDIEKLETGEVTTPSACQALCKGRTGCYYWTWVKTTQSCYLKNPYALQGWLRNSSTMDKISGAKDCVPAPPTCHELDVDYRGFDVQKLETNSINSYVECQSLCEANERCFYWTWVSQKKSCYLKDHGALLGRVQDAATAGLVSGPKLCAPHEHCYEIDVDYRGFDTEKIENGKVTSAALCHHHCLASAACAYWTWVGQTSNCYLKNSSAVLGRVQDFSTVGMVSGPRTCFPAAGTLEINVDFFGHNIKLIDDGSIRSYTDCQYVCQQYTDCHYWTYYQDSRSCFLKNASAPTMRVPRQSTVSGPKFYDQPSFPEPPTPEGPLPECFHTNVEFTGTEVQSLVSSTATECHATCQTSNVCSFFTFYRHERRCVLKTSETGEPLKELPVGFAVSGMRSCSIGQPHDSAPPCAVYNTEYVGQESDSDAAISAVECQVLCQRSRLCNFFTYYKQDGRCALKQFDSHSAELQEIPFGYAISATKYCGPPPSSAVPSCADRNVEYLGATVGDVATTTSAADCQALCQNAPTCEFFTFDGRTTACVLKKAYPGGEDKIYKLSKPYAASALKYCVPSQADPECAEKDTLYLGIDTAPIVTVETALECQKLCQHSTECEFFTFNDVEKRCRQRRSPVVGATVQKVSFPNVVSAMKYCTSPNEPQTTPYSEENVELKSHNLEISPVAADNVTACLDACNNQADCYYWTFYSTVDRAMSCHLKNARAMAGKTQFAGAVSGSREVEIALDPQTEYVGANLPQDPVAVASPQECREACSLAPECAYWTYYSNRVVNCFLKDSAAKDSRRKNPDATSGSRHAVMGPVPMKYLDDRKYEPAMSAGPAAFRTVLTTFTAEQCQARAQANTQKLFWSWNKFDHTCNFYGPEVVGTETYDFEWVSGHAESQDKSYSSEAYTYGQGVYLLHLGSFEAKQAPSPKACAEECGKSKLCRSASFTRGVDGGAPNCYLGGLAGQTLAASKDSVVVAQNRATLMVAKKPIPSHLEEHPDTPIPQCIDLCRRSGECKRWAFDLSKNICYLYREIGAEQDDPNFLIADIGIHLEEIEQLILLDTALTPTAVESIVTPVANCKNACQKVQCFAYSYVPAAAGGSDICHIGNIREAKDLKTFAVSRKGSVLIRNPGGAMATGVAYVGEASKEDASQLNAASACAEACSSARDCKAWTFRGEEKLCDLFASVSGVVPDSGSVVSGNETADAATLEKSPTKAGMAISTSWKTTVLAKQPMSTEQECEELCATTENCVQWSAATQEDGTVECIAGTWNAALEEKTNAHTSVLGSRFFTPFLELKGTTITTDEPDPSLDPAKHCATRCATEVDTCHAWTLLISSSTKTCHYFTEEAAVVSVTNPVAVSGSRGVLDIQLPVIYGAHEEPKAQADPATSVLACQQKCEGDASCLAWTWNYTQDWPDACTVVTDPLFKHEATNGTILVMMERRFLQPFLLLAGEDNDVLQREEGSATTDGLCQCMGKCYNNAECSAWAFELTENGSVCKLYSAFEKQPGYGFGISGSRRDASSCPTEVEEHWLLENPVTSGPEGTLDEILGQASQHKAYTAGVALVTAASSDQPQYILAKAGKGFLKSNSSAAIIFNYVEIWRR
ncbi:PAN domain-containing protein [Besnoitia besnoiti]|uniref:PAN domain-containing protein n=1 Tax=Besnoitia besnoiti TaxID=94643 RepID=A0A2A9MK31_BESBE|nr:PAN domain-containing protein [Besnoitia besnoiti]PFH35770.1 PAN domain-containing protein [Besnoitia besnoiti]